MENQLARYWANRVGSGSLSSITYKIRVVSVCARYADLAEARKLGFADVVRGNERYIIHQAVS